MPVFPGATRGGGGVVGTAILGFGRFGRALAALVEGAGERVRALDPVAEVPAALRAGSLADLAAGARLVILAVPVAALDSALRSLRPVLGPQHIVLDVTSIKLRPAALFAAHLGDDVPWVLTHPLFGPTSLALGERPLQVVVCPNARHPQAVADVRRFFEQLDCEVLDQDAESHDRCMARTHALAFFLAKGLLDVGVDQDLRAAPPSFRALARTMEAVRSDAAHLFAAIQTENPFAAAARRELLASLTRVHERLSASGELPVLSAGTPPPELEPQPLVDLELVRRRIDELDGELVALLNRRSLLSRLAGQAKAAAGRPVRDEQREADLLLARRRWGRHAGLDEEALEEVFRAVLRLSRREQGEHKP